MVDWHDADDHWGDLQFRRIRFYGCYFGHTIGSAERGKNTQFVRDGRCILEHRVWRYAKTWEAEVA